MYIKAVVCIILSLVVNGCTNEERTPSNRRLELAANIKLPPNFMVTKDEYQDMLRDYSVYYNLKFDTLAMDKLTESIKASRFYDKNGSPASYSESLLLRKPHNFSLWYPEAFGFAFKGKDGAVLYTITVNTTTCTLHYVEFVL